MAGSRYGRQITEGSAKLVEGGTSIAFASEGEIERPVHELWEA